MKNSSVKIENRTRDLPGCSAVPHLTAPPRAPFFTCTVVYSSARRILIVFILKAPLIAPCNADAEICNEHRSRYTTVLFVLRYVDIRINLPSVADSVKI